MVTLSDFNFGAIFSLLPATSTAWILAADWSWDALLRMMDSNLLALSCRLFRKNHDWTAAENSINTVAAMWTHWCRTTSKDRRLEQKTSWLNRTAIFSENESIYMKIIDTLIWIANQNALLARFSSVTQSTVAALKKNTEHQLQP